MLGYVTLVVCSIWVLSEIALSVMKRAGSGTRRDDRGSLRLLNAVIYISVAAGVFLAVRGVGHVSIGRVVREAGLGLVVGGLALRWWAILTLRRWFTVDVAVHEGQTLVRHGPYRLVRHPAYSGSLLSFAGLALFLASWVSALVIVIPIAAAFLRRIAIEERVLVAAFPAEYREYANHSSRLIPLIY